MNRHFPGAAWLRLGRPAWDRLRAYKAEQGLRTLEDAVERLLEASDGSSRDREGLGEGREGLGEGRDG